MIFPNEFEECTIMSQKCPNCGRFTNASCSRLVKDSCGHMKCRKCLLYEEHGCKTCQAKHCTHSTENYREPSLNGDPSDTNKASNEENVLPLELVINKDSKSLSKENHYDLISECGSSDIYHDNITFNDNEESYKSVTNDTACIKSSNKQYIPKVDSDNVVLKNIHTHLKNKDDRSDLASLQNRLVRKHDSQTEEKHKEEAAEKVKNAKHPDRSHITFVSDNPERYKCNACGKIFRNKKGKSYHDACVTGIRPFQCTFCDRSFVKRSHFEYHERVHRGYRPYKCNLCEKAFPQQNKLNRHMLSHSQEKQFICSVCNKRFSNRDDLKTHLNKHNATTTYTCKFCNKSFHVLTNLKRHMRTHTSERPHTCDQCNKSFKDKSMLIRHKRTHGKERPFSCAHCNRVFLSKCELRRHLAVHSDEKPFSCEYCQTQFRRKDNLNRHIRHHHSENSSAGVEAKNKAPPVVVIEADRSCSVKNSNQQPRQRQKSKKTQPKSPGKITVNSSSSSHDQINSRLDSMGNITPVIRATGEVSNAVPVINGPIRRLEERSDRKMFPYTEPIPIAEAAVLNCRIEEKLYPQSASSHNYFVHSYLKDRNSKVNSYPNNNKFATQESSNSVTATLSHTRLLPFTKTASDQLAWDFGICEQKSNQDKDRAKEDERTRRNDGNSEEPINDVSLRDEQVNCVSTIKKHIVQQSNGNPNENSANNGNSETINHATLSKDFQDICKRKKSEIHWRRRTAETLKPCNR